VQDLSQRLPGAAILVQQRTVRNPRIVANACVALQVPAPTTVTVTGTVPAESRDGIELTVG
jgi:hypothetical protein